MELYRPITQILNISKEGVSVWYICEVLGCSEKQLNDFCTKNRFFHFVKSQWIVRTRSSSYNRTGVAPNADPKIYLTYLLIKNIIQLFENNGNEFISYEEGSALVNWQDPHYDILRHLNLPGGVESDDSISKFSSLLKCFCCFEHKEEKFRTWKTLGEEIKAIGKIRNLLKSHPEGFVSLQELENALCWYEFYESSLGKLYSFLAAHQFDIEWGGSFGSSRRDQVKTRLRQKIAQSESLLQQAYNIVKDQGGEAPIGAVVRGLYWDRLGLGMLGSHINQYWSQWMRFSNASVLLVPGPPPLPQFPEEEILSLERVNSPTQLRPLGDTDELVCMVESAEAEISNDNEDISAEDATGGKVIPNDDVPLDDIAPVPKDKEEEEGERESECKDFSTSVTAVAPVGSLEEHPQVWNVFLGDIYHIAVAKIAVESVAEIPVNVHSTLIIAPLMDKRDFYFNDLGKHVREAFDRLRAKSTDIELRKKVHSDIHRMLKEAFPQIPTLRLFCFGSSACMLCTPTSDIDLCVILDDTYNGYLSKRNVERKITEICSILRKRVEANPIFATVPIVKGKCSGVEFDLGLSYSGVVNTTLLRQYMETNLLVLPPLIICVVAWSKYELINDNRNGFFSSYTLVLMMIYYLSRVGAVSLIPINTELIPLENPLREVELPAGNCADTAEEYSIKLGKLFFGFFLFYSRLFKYDEEVIQIRSSNRMTKEFKHWSNFEIACEDPLETHLNTARHIGAGQFLVIQTKFERALSQSLKFPRDMMSRIAHIAAKK